MKATYTMRDLPVGERPREKLLKNQAETLSLIELIAIILGSGTRERPVLQLAQDIVAHFGSLENLAGATVQELCQIKGIGPAKAIQLMAAFKLGIKLSQIKPLEKYRIEHPLQAYHLIKDHIEHQNREYLMAILLDVKNCVITHCCVSIGTLTESLVHPREVFYPAIRHKAVSLILAHNHPSGDPTPSREDLQVTKKLISVGELLGISLQDHIIVGKNGFISMREQKQI